MKAHDVMRMQGLCVKVTAFLLGKQHLYLALEMVNICTVKAREFNPSAFPLPFVLSTYQHKKTEQ